MRPGWVSVALVITAACSPTTLSPPLDPARAPLAATDDPAVVARGRYLVNGPAHCVGCHTPDGPLTPVDFDSPPPMVGGYAFSVPGGTVRSPNLTQHPDDGIGGWTDAEIIRALRYGRGQDGGALIPFMELQGLSDEDVVAVVSYLRTLDAAPSDVRRRQVNLFGRLLVSLFVKAKGPTTQPPLTSPTGPSVERGQYLANVVAGCGGCHTRRTQTGGYQGARFSGGFHLPSEIADTLEFVTPNLTPDSATGRITSWTEDQFVARFRVGRVIPGSPMPWSSFAIMEEDDLRSIFRYFRTLPPTRHAVDPVVRTAYRPAWTVGLLAGASPYDLTGTGTSFAVAGHLAWPLRPALTIEPGITYFAYDASSTLLFPELSVQLGVPRGPIRPFLGGGIGLTIPLAGGDGTHRAVHAVAGVRIPLRSGAWSVRGELRVRSPRQWGSVTTDYMFGVTRRLP